MCSVPKLPVFVVIAVAVYLGAAMPNLHAQTGQPVILGWDASTGDDVAGYMLCTGTVSGAYTQSQDVGPSTTGTLTNLQPGTTYYVAAVAYDSFGLQSGPSNEVSFTTAAAPVVSLVCSATNGTAPATLVLTASAADSGATITQVNYFNNGTLIGRTTGGPFTWLNVPSGNYNLTAEAIDSNGANGTSNTVGATVTDPPAVNTVQLQSDGSLAFSVSPGTGGNPDQTYDVWVSSDLQNWTLLQTVTAQAGSFAITDPAANGSRYRFYKVSPQ